MRRDRRIANEFNLDRVQEVVNEAVNDILANSDWYTGEYDEVHQYLLETYAPDWLGTHQAEDIKDRFNLKLKLDEWIWEDIDRIFDDVADILNKRLNLSHPQLGYMSLGFGHGEGSPDWGLLLYFEMKGE